MMLFVLFLLTAALGVAIIALGLRAGFEGRARLVAWGLLAQDGSEIASGMHVLTESNDTLVFDDIAAEPVPSILRGFSALAKAATRPFIPAPWARGRPADAARPTRTRPAPTVAEPAEIVGSAQTGSGQMASTNHDRTAAIAFDMVCSPRFLRRLDGSTGPTRTHRARPPVRAGVWPADSPMASRKV